MNEKVKQISKQAGNYADIKAGKDGEFYPHYTQKFTDLIVQEVLSKIGSHWSPGDIKRHFGVEE